jgi:hypothetical protein
MIIGKWAGGFVFTGVEKAQLCRGSTEFCHHQASWGIVLCTFMSHACWESEMGEEAV